MGKEIDKKGVKNRIIDSAWKLFHDKGYNRTTVDDIIELSGTSKGSFYYYFNTKDELLNTLSFKLDGFYEDLKNNMDPDENSFDKLLFLNKEIHTIIEENLSLDVITSLYSTQLIAGGNRLLLDQNRVYYKLINSIVEEGQKRGQIKKDKSVLEIVKYYTLCERALVSDWCLNKGSYSLGKYSEEYMCIMMEHFKA